MEQVIIHADNLEQADALITARKSFIVQGMYGVNQVAREIEKKMDALKLKSRLYTSKRSLSLAAMLIPTGITQVFGAAAAVGIAAHNVATYDPDYEIVKYVKDNKIAVICVKEENFFIRADEMQKIGALITAKKSFIIYGVGGRKGMSETTEAVEKEIEMQQMRCRIYSSKRALILAAALIPTGFTQLTALGSGIGMAIHNLVTWNPDYEIIKYNVDNKVSVIYQKSVEDFYATAKAAEEAAHAANDLVEEKPDEQSV